MFEMVTGTLPFLAEPPVRWMTSGAYLTGGDISPVPGRRSKKKCPRGMKWVKRTLAVR